MARNQAWSLTHVTPIRKPTTAENTAPMKIPIIGGIPKFIASNDELNPPIPKNAACPSEPCPELANRFQLEAYIVKMAISVTILIMYVSLTKIGKAKEDASAIKIILPFVV